MPMHFAGTGNGNQFKMQIQIEAGTQQSAARPVQRLGKARGGGRQTGEHADSIRRLIIKPNRPGPKCCGLWEERGRKRGREFTIQKVVGIRV